MILVELTRDMRPSRAGDHMLLPDDIARRLIDAGDATNPRDRFGKPLAAKPPDEGPAAPRHPRRKYLTK